MFPRNEGTVDRVLRVVVGALMIGAFFYFPSESPWQYAWLIGLVPLLTGLVGSCPLYRIFGLSTCPLKRS